MRVSSGLQSGKKKTSQNVNNLQVSFFFVCFECVVGWADALEMLGLSLQHSFYRTSFLCNVLWKMTDVALSFSKRESPWLPPENVLL